MRLSRLNLVVDMNKNPFASIVNLFTFSVCLAGMAALLLPTIVKRRHASRASACSNNLRQIGLGFHNYHSAYKQLPWATGGTTGNSAPELSNGGRLGPFVGLLPFLEQQQLWEMISNPYVNPNTGQAFPPMGPVPWYAPTKYEPWGMSPEIYHCPGDGPAQDLSSAPKTVYSLASALGSSTTSNYVACYGDGTLLQAEQDATETVFVRRRKAANRGIFKPGERTKFRDTLDGLSYTIFFSEVVASRVRRPGSSEVIRDVIGISKNPSLCLDAAQSGDREFWPFGRGAIWADGFLPISGFQTILPPNSPSCTSDLGIEDTISSASSAHAGGVHVLMGDGSVRFASNTIDTGDLTSPGVYKQPEYLPAGAKSPYGLWGALGTRANAEPIMETPGLVSIPRDPSTGGNSPSPKRLIRWTDKSGGISLQAEMIQIIDQKTIQLKDATGTLHEVPLNTLKDRDIYRAIQMDVMRRAQ